MADAELRAKFFELGIVKLLVVVRYYDIWYAKAVYDVCPNEAHDLVLVMLVSGSTSTHLVK